ASVASLFAILLTDRGINGGDSIKALVFLTIIMTVFIQGLTARSVAKVLGITQADATGVVIVGCNPMGRLVGRLFNQQGESVVMFDTDEEACELARQDGLRVYLSSALDAELLDEAGLSSIGTFVALTTNGEVNSVVAERAAEEFQPPRVVAVLPRNEQDQDPKANGKSGKVTSTPLAIKTWNTYLTDDAAELKTTQLQAEDFEKQRDQLNKLLTGGDLLPITLQRNGKLDVVLGPETWQPGDTITYLMHDPTPQLMKRLSGGKRTGRLVTETLPSTEISDQTTATQTEANNEDTTATGTKETPSGDLQTS
ncbi:MAG: sodium:proton antiporter, partial [Leptolyngbya sp. SIO3F4]|nr:sodium:proton antiporter [Leptolyngbya sp. SIO3F4]